MDKVAVGETPSRQTKFHLHAGTTLRRRVGKVANRVTAGRPHLLVVLASLLALGLSYIWAYLIRFEFAIPGHFTVYMAHTLPVVIIVQCLLFYFFGVFRILWAYIDLRDVIRILRASVASTLILLLLNLGLRPPEGIPRSVLVLDGLFSFLAVSGLFAGLRVLRDASPRLLTRRTRPEPVLIVGAGDSGETLLHEIERGLARSTRVVGFLDDDPAKCGRWLRGLPVLGRVDQARAIAENAGVRTVYVAIPSADGEVMKRIVGCLREGRLRIKVLPPLGKLSPALGLLSQLRNVSIEDLLRRKPIKLDQAAISAFIKDKVILVTGAAGSIGSEICRQVLPFHPARLVILDCAETPLHDLLLEFSGGMAAGQVHPELADVTDPARIRSIFQKHRPQVVFHAAALKHVPICEDHPREAIRVNIGGIRNLGEA
ncbi:MAG TPA: polysaccharide biosynthesis protein, partial [Planctomycetota bacterium]|nr:polysaccharide biosynthesis protein [Planctomycetota bacterium]